MKIRAARRLMYEGKIYEQGQVFDHAQPESALRCISEGSAVAVTEETSPGESAPPPAKPGKGEKK